MARRSQGQDGFPSLSEEVNCLHSIGAKKWLSLDEAGWEKEEWGLLSCAKSFFAFHEKGVEFSSTEVESYHT